MSNTDQPAARYKLVSASWIYTPNVFQWILSGVRPFDHAKAANLFEGLGLPLDVAQRLAVYDDAVTWEINAKEETVTVNVAAGPVSPLVAINF